MTIISNDRTSKPAPPGAIRTRNEIGDLVIEARKEKKAIRVWTVTQSGYLSCFYITSKSRLHKPDDKPHMKDYANDPSFWYVSAFHDHANIGYRTTNKRWFRHDEIMGSYNIESFGGNCHYAFTSKIAALRYSEELKNDEAYLLFVKQHHDRCKRMFREMDAWY